VGVWGPGGTPRGVNGRKLRIGECVGWPGLGGGGPWIFEKGIFVLMSRPTGFVGGPPHPPPSPCGWRGGGMVRYTDVPWGVSAISFLLSFFLLWPQFSSWGGWCLFDFRCIILELLILSFSLPHSLFFECFFPHRRFRFFSGGERSSVQSRTTQIHVPFRLTPDFLVRVHPRITAPTLTVSVCAKVTPLALGMILYTPFFSTFKPFCMEV